MATIQVPAGQASITSGNPDDMFLLAPGQRERLSLVGLRGTPAQPIVIQGYGTHISGGSVGMYVDGCQHIRVTGIEISRFGNAGITARKGTDHLEIEDCFLHDGMTGIRISNLAEDVGEGFVANWFHVHDCMFEDLEKEAGYLGHGADQTNPGTPIRQMLIEHCVCRRCGYDGIQVREVREAIVRFCVCEDIGANVAGTSQGGAGVIVGHGTKAEVHDNTIVNTDRGIQLLDHLDGTELHHNLIVHCGYVRDQDGIIAFTSAPVLIHHNTIVASSRRGIRIKAGTVRDNFVVASGGAQIDADDGALVEYNAFAETVEQARFTDPSSGDYTLQSDSPAVGKASDGKDAGAYQPSAPPPPPPDPPPDPPPPEEPAITMYPDRFRVTLVHTNVDEREIVTYTGWVERKER